MKIVSLINEKGGTGKSTVATNLAVYLHRNGKRVVLVDADPQGTASDWRAAGDENDLGLPAVIAVDRPKNLASALRSLNADYAVIDSPGSVGEMAPAIVSASDVALIVIRPSAADLWASAVPVRLIRQKLDMGGKINAAFLLNQTFDNTKLTKEIRAGEWNDEYGFDQLDTALGNRVAFAEALSKGRSIFDTSDAAARLEFNALMIELEAKKWL